MQPNLSTEAAAFSGYIDLASARLGGRSLIANDEFFAEKENLVKPGRATFDPDRYTDHGKWMDGWETRRRRTPGHDWCILRLGLPGEIHGFDIDTQHFLGNNPAYASVDACEAPDGVKPEALAQDAKRWTEILPRSPLRPGSQNLFAAVAGERSTHVRLNIFPDGGVARFRVYGRVAPDRAALAKQGELDLAAVENGGLVVAASDMFFGSKENLIMPGLAATMGDGWETRRRRGPGYDWAVVALGLPGRITRAVVSTRHFKGNYPDRCSIDACSAPDAAVDSLNAAALPWREILPSTPLAADTEREFSSELAEAGPCTHVRLNIYPDGGVSRLRVFGTPA